MKQIILTVVLANLLFAGNAQVNKRSSGNPILPGWYADPEAAIFAKQYWIFPTWSDKYEKQVFFDAFSSANLIQWEKHPKVLDTSAIKWANKAMWAPAVVNKDNRYFLFFAANDIQNNKEYGGIGLAVADRPEGPYADYLGKPLIDQFYNGAQPIDQFVFKDSDGSYYIIYGGWRHCNIAKLQDDFKAIVPHRNGELFKEITPENYVEGPFMFLRNNKYYFMWSEGGWTGPDYSVAYAIGDSPLGPFKRIGKILQQDPGIATGAGHHSVIHDSLNNQWYIVYHRRPLGETAANNRVTCIENLRFDSNGLILPVKLTATGVQEHRLK